METRSLRWSAFIAISAMILEVLVHNDVETPLRTALALGFLLICPGVAFIQLLHFEDLLYEIVLAVALSLALDLLIAAILLYSGLWSPELILLILIALSAFGVFCRLIQWLRLRARSATLGHMS